MAKECCAIENQENPKKNHTHAENEHSHDDDHNHGVEVVSWKEHWQLILAFSILLVMLILQYGSATVFPNLVNLLVYGIAYLLAGWKVLDLAFRKLKRFDIFNEFFLMSAATIGAFLIGQYSEGVAVMVFYSIGEWFQDEAVGRAKRNIKSLLDIRPDEVTVIRNGSSQKVSPSDVQLNEIIQIKAGEKVALDGNLMTENASFNTAALTGESKPDTKYKGDTVFAGMINLNTVADVKVSSLFKDSKLSKIVEMVQDATARKSQTQLFISKFAKVYTPIVFGLALLLCFLPYFILADYNFNTWFYRSLVFLVISCPCALVVSIPLGYFGGIGLASKNGILFKGGNFLDVMTKINLLVMDKTGTLTKGIFKVQQVVANNSDEKGLIRIAAILEHHSTHPVARAITEYAGEAINPAQAEKVEEIAGHGLKGISDGKEILVGNLKLLKKFSVSYPPEIEDLVDTVVLISIDGKYSGYIIIADELKEDAAEVIGKIHRMGIKTVMLSGDKQTVVEKVAKYLKVDNAFGNLLPEGKVEKVQNFKDEGFKIAFVGDGVNDAPVIALADVGIAMGGLGSDAAIETADLVIQNDQLSKIISAIKIGKLTRNVVWQNIIFAMVVKVIVLALGAGGIATLWEAVIADVGVALLAILNAVRVQRMKV